jgi:hypothetical protein
MVSGERIEEIKKNGIRTEREWRLVGIVFLFADLVYAFLSRKWF